MNIYRMEVQSLKVNIAGVILACITTGISVFWLKNLTVAICSIVVNQVFRNIYAEVVLLKKLGIKDKRPLILELLMTVVFITASWFIGGWWGVGVYAMAYGTYCFIERKKIKDIVNYLKEFVKSKKKNTQESEGN